MDNNQKNELIIKVSTILHDYIHNNSEMRGQCLFIPLFMKKYLFEQFDIILNIEYGFVEIIEKDDKTKPYKINGLIHCWNTFEEKIIDITIHNQSEEINTNALILNKEINTTNKKRFRQYFRFQESKEVLKQLNKEKDLKLFNFWEKNCINSFRFLSQFIENEKEEDNYAKLSNIVNYNLIV